MTNQPLPPSLDPFASNTSAASLFDLPVPYLQNIIPPEIRLLIFRYLLVRAKDCVLTPQMFYKSLFPRRPYWYPSTSLPYYDFEIRQVPPKQQLLYPQVLATCHQFYDEGYGILYSQNSFQYLWGDGKQMFSGHLPPHGNTSLRLKALWSINHLVFRNAWLVRDFGDITVGFGSFFPNVKTVTLYLDTYNALEGSDLQIPDPIADFDDDDVEEFGEEFVGEHPRKWDDSLRLTIDKLRKSFPALKHLEVGFDLGRCRCRSLYMLRYPLAREHLPDSCDKHFLEFRLNDYYAWLWAHQLPPRAPPMAKDIDSLDDKNSGESITALQKHVNPADEGDSTTETLDDDVVTITPNINSRNQVHDEQGYATQLWRHRMVPLATDRLFEGPVDAIDRAYGVRSTEYFNNNTNHRGDEADTESSNQHLDNSSRADCSKSTTEVISTPTSTCIAAHSNIDPTYHAHMKEGYASHPRAAYPLPLNFRIHHERMRHIRETLGEEKDNWEWSFSTHTSWRHPPRVLIQMRFVQSMEPVTKVVCSVTGDWGQQSHVEELEL